MRPRIDRTRFHELFEAGKSASEIGKELECNPTTVWRIHRALNLPPFTNTQKWMTPERKARIQAMLDDGQSFAEITRTEGAAPCTLNRHFPGQHWTKEERAEFLRITRSPTRRR